MTWIGKKSHRLPKLQKSWRFITYILYQLIFEILKYFVGEMWRNFGLMPKFFPGEFLPGEFLPGKFLPGEFLPGEFLPGEFLPGEFLPGEFLPGEFLPGEFLPGKFLPGKFLPGEFLPGKFLPCDFLPGEFPPDKVYVNAIKKVMWGNDTFSTINRTLKYSREGNCLRICQNYVSGHNYTMFPDTLLITMPLNIIIFLRFFRTRWGGNRTVWW